MSTRRITVKQSDNTIKKVAFLDDVTLNGLTGTGLISVTGDKEKTVTTDGTKLTLSDGNVKVVTPLVLNVQSAVPSVTTNSLYSVNDGSENKLYWNGKVIDAHTAGEGYVLESTFSSHTGNGGTAKHVSATELGQLEATDGKALATQEWACAEFADLDDFNTLSGSVNTISGKVTTLESNVATLETDVDAVESDIATLKTDVDTVEGKVDTLETTVATISSEHIKDITDSSGNAPVVVTYGRSLTPNTLTTSVTVTPATQDATTKELSGTGLVSGAQAQAAIDATVDTEIEGYNTAVIGVWSTISDKTVKAAIEENKAKITALEGNHFIVVNTLPATGELNCIYLVPKEGSETGNVKEEWIYVNDAWEKIGDTAVDLSNYYTKTQTDGFINTLDGKISDEEDRAEAAEATLTTAVETAQTTADNAATAAATAQTTADNAATAAATAQTTANNAATSAADAQTDVDNLETLVGTLPASATATTVVGYVDEKAAADVAALRDTADTASAADANTFVTVGLTGTVGNHSLTVTTSNIAKASELGDVTTLTTTATGSVVAAVNEVNTTASSALQTVTSTDATNIQITKSGTNAAITPTGAFANLLAYCNIVEE